MHRRLIGAFLVALCSVFLSASVRSMVHAQTPREEVPVIPGIELSFIGVGAGHGVGMDQWGARGRALAGENYQQILAAYYPGTALTTTADDSLKIRVRLDNGTVDQLPMARYVASVVSAEMPASFPQAAKEAQAVASRTFAVYALNPAHPYDVTAGVDSQAFTVAARSDASQAVADTAGQILTFQGRVAFTPYFECGMGMTESNQNVWNGAPLPYLQAHSDLNAAGQPYSAGCPRASWSAGPFDQAMLSRILGTRPQTGVGTVTGLLFHDRSLAGRWGRVTIRGKSGQVDVSVALFRIAVNSQVDETHTLFSPAFTVVWGNHAVQVGGDPTLESLPAAPLLSFIGR